MSPRAGIQARPRSAVSGAVGFAGLIAAVGGLLWAFHAEYDPALSGLAVIGAALFPSLFFDGAPRAFKAWRAGPRHFSPLRLAIKLAGVFATLGVVGFAVFVFPFFHRQELASLLNHAAEITMLGLPLLFLYVAAADSVAAMPEDGLYAVGAATLGIKYDYPALRDFGLTQAIKVCFLTLMLSYLSQDIAFFRGLDWRSLRADDHAVIENVNRLVFTCDVALGALGYLATLSLFGWQVREPDRTAAGWLSCIICYEPFWPAIGGAFFAYHGPGDWHALFGEGSFIYWIWVSAFTACNLVYLLATAAFGPQFSNLTRRGIMTSGPYRYTKHPAYVGKNLGYWINEAPFLLTTSLPNAITRIVMLLGVNAIYVARARCEERLLAQDPVYGDYAAYISRFGALARLTAALRQFRDAGRRPQEQSGQQGN
jgi:protein-S-isoprenylcysteine O-methyltransferase Ste14